MLQEVYSAFGLISNPAEAVPFGSGLINHTWKIFDKGKYFILQRINEKVFTDPFAIASNMKLAESYLQQHYPEYLFVECIQTKDGSDLYFDKASGYFRLSPFIPGSHTVDVVEKPAQAYEAARQFGLFTRLLSGLDVSRLKITLPHFHNLSLRYAQFERALENGNPERLQQSKESIRQIRENRDIVTDYENIVRNPEFRLRAIHHDTKISNVLFDDHDKGICVIDLDTLMPGYFISDLGDMLRTYVSPVSEEETDFSKIKFREEYFDAIINGYLGELKNELTNTEREHIVYAGKFMIYMQAIRFLTDYLENDSYYGARYEGHNFVRANNQLTLLQRLNEKEEILNTILRH